MRPLVLTFLVLAALLARSPGAAAAAGWAWPVRGDVLTQFRNGDDPYAAGQHRGVDIAAPAGTPVVAAASGTVVWSGVVGSSGLTVAERTTDGRYELSYLHLSATSVRRGQAVTAGERLGAVGVSGTRSAAQPHLHFGVREAGDRHAYVDPLGFLAPPPAERPEPRAQPVPVAEPVANAPEGAPVPTVAVPPVPVPVPGGARAPAAGHVAAPRVVSPAPAGVPSPVGHHRVAVQVDSHPARTARPSSPPDAVDAESPQVGPRSAQHGRSAAHGPVEPAGARPVVAARHAPPHSQRGGIDLGWLAACAGMVAAAALLGSSHTGSGGRRFGRGAYTALLRAGSRPGDA